MSENYFKVFGKTFIFGIQNLLISANFSNPNWLPSNEQISKINNVINESSKDNIILLSHQIFWLENADFEMNPNSYALLEEDLKKDSLSWLENQKNKNIIVISGDYGAQGQATACYLDENKLFIANGIGENENDTIIKISETKNLLFIEELSLNNE